MKSLISIFFVAIALLMMMAGCTNAQRSNQSTKHQNTKHQSTKNQALLTITREDPLHQFKNDDFSKTINDKKQVTQLMSMLKNLPEFPKGTIYCPDDSGVAYKLDFKNAKIIATVRASGCQQVSFNNKVYWGIDQKSNGFMSYLMKILGMNRPQFTGIGKNIESSVQFSENNAVAMVLKDHPDFPSAGESKEVETRTGGPAPGLLVKGELKTTVESTKETDTYIVTLTKVWHQKVNGIEPKSVWKYKVTGDGKVILISSQENADLINTIK